MTLFDRLLGRARGQTAPDGYAIAPDHPNREAHVRLEGVIQALLPAADSGGWAPFPPLSDLEEGRALLALDHAALVPVALAGLERAVWLAIHNSGSTTTPNYRRRILCGWVLQHLLRRKLPFTVDQLAEVLGWIATVKPPFIALWLPLKQVLTAVERCTIRPRGGDSTAIPPAIRAGLQGVQDRLRSMPYSTSDLDEMVRRIDTLVAGPAEEPVLEAGEQWVDAVNRDLAESPDSSVIAWTDLLRHCAGAGVSPSARWRKSLQQHVTAVGEGVFRERAATWIAAFRGGPNEAISRRNDDVLRGLISARALSPDDGFAQTLGDVAITAAKKVPNIGPRSIKVFNACLTALGSMDTPAALAQLTRLRARLKAPRIHRAVTTALEAAAGRQGVGLAELEELVVPTFGMTEVGVLRVAIGEWTAQVKIVGTHEVEVRWIAPSGRVQASAPAALKEAHRGAVAEVARTAKEMAAMLVAQRDRLELLPLGGRTWPAGTWRERYLDHPLLGPLARRLLWRISDENGEQAVAWDGARLVDVTDRAITLGDAASVQPWHPLTADVDTVRAWRQWLERHQVVQPFKQAHREIYVLTDAERRTRDYSNRFAAHIIKQHQFAALCRARGWRYQLQGWFDNANTPTRDLPEHGLKVEFWVEPCVTDDTAASGAGIALYATTDQVRFVGADGQPVPLDSVPPLVFSELLRDVDLFVGVASVGADPSWLDQGQRPAYDQYWRTYAFGELATSAITRREVLTQLLPRLAIAGRCTLEERFLVVRGELRTYKIHLGSGNILMSPNDQYLCIVPDRAGPDARGRDRIWLPFEGDGTLSVILSKAVLLSNDAAITDPSITRQLRAG